MEFVYLCLWISSAGIADMKRSPSASRALSALSLVFVLSTLLTLYMLSIQENLQYADDQEVLQRTHKVKVKPANDQDILQGTHKEPVQKLDNYHMIPWPLPHAWSLQKPKQSVDHQELYEDAQRPHEKDILQKPYGMMQTHGQEAMKEALYAEEVLQRPSSDMLYERNLMKRVYGLKTKQKPQTETNENEVKPHTRIDAKMVQNVRVGRILNKNNVPNYAIENLRKNGEGEKLSVKHSVNTSYQDEVMPNLNAMQPEEKFTQQLHNRKILETKHFVSSKDIKSQKSNGKSNGKRPSSNLLKTEYKRNISWHSNNATSDQIPINIYGNQHSDRILDQIKLSEQMGNSTQPRRLKTIVLKSTFDDVISGQYVFQKCPVKECKLTRTADQADMVTADAILFGHDLTDPYPYHLRSPNQIWIYFNLESSINTKLKMNLSNSAAINWTASYRRDSTLVAPYEKFILFENVTDAAFSQTPSSTSSTTFSLLSHKRSLLSPMHSLLSPTSTPSSPTASALWQTLLSTSHKPPHNYAAGKTNKVAWFVSNCDDGNGRKTYARQLSEHISVHVYGACGQRKCPRSTEDYCFSKLQKEYKFYLAFENSNCRDYITEKFFRNALMHNVIPIVMGAPKEDYEKVAPPHSFIHVDDFHSPRHLAQYLHVLDRDDVQYNQYFSWKSRGRFIDTQFFCRLCAMLHRSVESGHVMWQERLEEWWNEKQCIQPNTWASWAQGYRTV